MPRFSINKLVRDKIVQKQLASGNQPTFRLLGAEAHKLELIKKIAEESQELASASDADLVSELADVQQALDDLCALLGIDGVAVGEAQRRKNDISGSFSKGIFLDRLELDAEDEWVEYYRSDPKRFPELD